MLNITVYRATANRDIPNINRRAMGYSIGLCGDISVDHTDKTKPVNKSSGLISSTHILHITVFTVFINHGLI